MFFNDHHFRKNQTWVSSLLDWYDSHKRPFPWRQEVSVYQTWICEVMSQQTTMAVVVPRFMAFVERLPSVTHLAQCSDEELRELWSGLGYYARARNLRKGAEYIVSVLQGEFPQTFEDWLKVPGVGPYTASVITSICFGTPKACVDGNVIRVIARLTACSTPDIWTEKGRKSIQAIADDCIAPLRPGDFNQAMMELGATVCHKLSPRCEMCPISGVCLAFQQNNIENCPTNKPRRTFENVELDALRIICSSEESPLEEQVLLVRRKKGFLLETVGFPILDRKRRDAVNDWLDALNVVEHRQMSEASVSHTITHHQLSVRPLDVSLKAKKNVSSVFLDHFAEYFADVFEDPVWVSKFHTTKTVASSLDRKIWENLTLF